MTKGIIWLQIYVFHQSRAFFWTDHIYNPVCRASKSVKNRFCLLNLTNIFAVMLLLEGKHQVEQLINAGCHSPAVTDQKSRAKMGKKNNVGDSHGVMK